MGIKKKIKIAGKKLVLSTMEKFPSLYVLFKKQIPPDMRWPPQEIIKKVKENENLEPNFLSFFTRDPERKVPKQKNIVVSPADGVVRNIHITKNKKIIDISMNFYDVHVQRVPISGKVVSVKEDGHKVKKGSKLERKYFENPWTYEKNYIFPVQKVITLQTEIGEVVVRQISSIWARRIETFVKPGDYVEIGQRIGRIHLGSTVVLELPKKVKITVKSILTDKKGKIRRRTRDDIPIIGGETIVARY
jgi:phosphatidylserine decarboxylase